MWLCSCTGFLHCIEKIKLKITSSTTTWVWIKLINNKNFAIWPSTRLQLQMQLPQICILIQRPTHLSPNVQVLCMVKCGLSDYCKCAIETWARSLETKWVWARLCIVSFSCHPLNSIGNWKGCFVAGAPSCGCCSCTVLVVFCCCKNEYRGAGQSFSYLKFQVNCSTIFDPMTWALIYVIKPLRVSKSRTTCQTLRYARASSAAEGNL